MLWKSDGSEEFLPVEEPGSRYGPGEGNPLSGWIEMKRMIVAGLLGLPLLLSTGGSAKAFWPGHHPPGPGTFNVQKTACPGGFCEMLFPGIHRHGPLFNHGPIYPPLGYPNQGGGFPTAGPYSPFEGLIARKNNLKGLLFGRRGHGAAFNECDSVAWGHPHVGPVVPGPVPSQPAPAKDVDSEPKSETPMNGTAPAELPSTLPDQAIPEGSALRTTSLRLPPGAGVATIRE